MCGIRSALAEDTSSSGQGARGHERGLVIGASIETRGTKRTRTISPRSTVEMNDQNGTNERTPRNQLVLFGWTFGIFYE